MFRLITVAGKSWWVPESDPLLLAVEISRPEQYRAAVKAKIEALVKAEGNEAKAMVEDALDWQMGDVIGITDNPQDLVRRLLEVSTLNDRVRAGDPRLEANPASQADAEDAVAGQWEVSLADFLG